MQEQLHAAHARIAAAEQNASQAEQLRVQLEKLQSHQKVWDQVLQVSIKAVFISGMISMLLLALYSSIKELTAKKLQLQGLPDAVSPESVLSLVGSLQTEALKSAEQLGLKNNDIATLKGAATDTC